VTDHYADGTYRWWHLSGPAPELVQALADGWLPASGVALDVGCGMGSEAARLHQAGWRVIAMDLSATALTGAAASNAGPAYLQASVLRTPLRPAAADACLDRGCFHYLAADERAGYAAELRRVLRPGGRLLLRACLRTAGARNDIDEQVITDTFAGWQIDRMERAQVPSDTRQLDVLEARLTR
jgi:SAM-dependent methyltransferase